mgnify:CR=1 FL=1
MIEIYDPETARQEWNDLPPDLRNRVIEMAEYGRGHPLPEVARIATSYARARQITAQRRLGLLRAITVLAAVGGIAVGIDLLDVLASNRTVGLITALAMVAILSGLLFLSYVALQATQSEWPLIEASNLDVLLWLCPAAPAPAEPFTVHRRGLWGRWAAPLAVISSSGINVPALRVTVPWSAVRRIGAWCHRSWRGQRAYLVWYLHDPRVVTTVGRPFSQRGRRLLRIARRHALLALPLTDLREPVEAIAKASVSFHHHPAPSTAAVVERRPDSGSVPQDGHVRIRRSYA